MLELIVGPMFSGKTQELMRRVERWRVARMNCLLVKWFRDLRYSEDKVVTHSGVECSVTTVSASTLEELDVSEYDVIGIDEGQFYPDLVETTKKWVLSKKRVIVSALDFTFEGKPFGDVHKLVCERIDKLTAVCGVCRGDSAIYSYRMVGDSQEELIGGHELYTPLCRMCFTQKNLKA